MILVPPNLQTEKCLNERKFKYALQMETDLLTIRVSVTKSNEWTFLEEVFLDFHQTFQR